MLITVTYLFDPLCGWYYGASPALQKLVQQNSIQLELAPTGLFAGANGRAMDAEFAQFAWSNDLRIGKMTGQQFTEKYRTQVLGQPGGRLDSETATRALTAVSLTEPYRELETLRQLQEARYVYGQDITSQIVVEKLLRDMGLAAAADLLAAGSGQLSLHNDARIDSAQRLMLSFGSNGVPSLIASRGSHRRILSSDALFGHFETMMSLL
jgi:putative protein-disulfide isomerase